jgi:hypothetical protein
MKSGGGGIKQGGNMKKVLIIALAIVVALFILSVVKDLVIKSAVSIIATQVTGAKVDIGSFSVGIIKQSVRIKGFKMYNPAGFPQGLLIDLPKVDVDYDLASLLKGKLHLKLLTVELKEIGLVKNKDGKLNVDSLKVAQQETKKDAKEQKPAKPLVMQIDELNLYMGRVVSKDYSSGQEPAIQVYDINLKKSYKNITSAQQLAALVLSEPMKAAGIKGAAIYGVSMLAGVAVLPVAVVATFAAKDSVQKDFNQPLTKVFDVSAAVLKKIGKVGKEDKAAGVISADVNGTGVVVKLKQVSSKTTQITISARKFMLPKPETANGVLYQISQSIK